MSDRPLMTRIAEITGIAGFVITLATLYSQVRTGAASDRAAPEESAERGGIAGALADLGEFHRDVQAWGGSRELSLIVTWAVVIAVVATALSFLVGLGIGAMAEAGNRAGEERMEKSALRVLCWVYVFVIVYFWVFARALPGWAIAVVFVAPLVLMVASARIGGLAGRRLLRS